MSNLGDALVGRLDQNVISLAAWFNEPLLGDIQIFASREEGAPSFYCNTTLLRRRSTKLVESLERTDRRLNIDNGSSGSSFKKVLIVEELEGKADLTQLFLRLLYDESAWDNDKCYPLLDVFKKYELYAFVWALTNQVPEEFNAQNQFFELGRIMGQSMPEANNPNTHDGDLLVKLKGTEYSYHCHSVVMANGLEYFKGLFRSGMKDSSAQEVTIELDDVTPDAFKVAFDALLHYVYRGYLKSVPAQESYVVAYALAVKYIAPKLEAELLRKVAFMCSTKTIGPVIYYSFKHEAQAIVDKATDILIPKFTQSAAEDSFRQVPKDYLLQFSAGPQSKNAYQYAIESQLDALIVKALDNISTILGDDPDLNLHTVDASKNTLLHLAVTGTPRPNTVGYLIQKGLNINAQNDRGLTPMGVILSNVGKTELELQHAMAQLLIFGATFDETKPELVRAFLTLAAQFDFKEVLFQNAWPAAQKIIDQLPSILKVFVDDFGQNTLDLALAYKCLPVVEYLLFKVGIPTGREVTILNHDNDDQVRAWYPEHDCLTFSVHDEHVFKLNKKNYNMKGAEIFASEERFGGGSWEQEDHVYDKLTVHVRSRHGYDEPLEFHGRRSPDWQRFLNLIQFLWVKSNVPVDRQNVAFAEPVKNGHLPTKEEIKQGLNDAGSAFKALGQVMSGLNISVKK